MSALVSPSIDYKESFLKGAQEFSKEGRLESTYAVALGYNLNSLETNFDQFVFDLCSMKNKNRLPEGFYIDNVMWLTDNSEYIGQVSIRPELATPYLITYGGHVGYSIRPDRRRHGYGKKILTLALEIVQKYDLHRVLVTCDSDNIGSKKIIESNGGCFESSITMTRDIFQIEGRTDSEKLEKFRYWIEI